MLLIATTAVNILLQLLKPIGIADKVAILICAIIAEKQQVEVRLSTEFSNNLDENFIFLLIFNH